MYVAICVCEYALGAVKLFTYVDNKELVSVRLHAVVSGTPAA